MNVFEECLKKSNHVRLKNACLDLVKERNLEKQKQKDLELAKYTDLYEIILTDRRYKQKKIYLNFIEEQIVKLGGDIPRV